MRRFVVIAALGLAMGSLVGCGGTGGGGSVAHPTARGRSLRLKMKFPPRKATTSRVIPTVTQSIAVEVWAGGAKFDSQLVTAGGDTAIFDELPVGSVEVRAYAYASADGTGVSAAKGVATATVDQDAPTDVTVTMASEIVRLEPSCGSTLTLARSATAVIMVVAKNAANQVVATDPTDVTPFVDDYSITDAVPDTSGHTSILPKTAGSTTVRFFDAISGVEGDVAVTVTP